MTMGLLVFPNTALKSSYALQLPQAQSQLMFDRWLAFSKTVVADMKSRSQRCASTAVPFLGFNIKFSRLKIQTFLAAMVPSSVFGGASHGRLGSCEPEVHVPPCALCTMFLTLVRFSHFLI